MRLEFDKERNSAPLLSGRSDCPRQLLSQVAGRHRLKARFDRNVARHAWKAFSDADQQPSTAASLSSRLQQF